MNGRQLARTALAQVLTVACVVLLCVFGAGPAAAMAAESRPASTAPTEPTEGPSDPAADPEARAAVRPATRGISGVRLRPAPVFHVKHAGARGCGATGSAPSAGAARSVVLRC
ncbi:hypothetical protein OG625_20020 [Streptomyces sp. NBC_01351]|uniref:hypothetical protein n=1 Tax=Streptomyces sp. NBC_01351 TaxID=2903833 RepID=UPI002E327326|nr:hypothetical protein [Streptomyces sp. NBC_01351]